MRSFFIDLENVRSYGLEGILLLKPDDKVYVFYSDNANTLTIPTIESLNESSAQVRYIKTNYIGANAMDFQIVTLLGASIEKEKTGKFYIISHDNGFKSAVKFCEGYFTGYDIVTGVFANILLAINSENGKSLGSGKRRKSSSENRDMKENIASEESQTLTEAGLTDTLPALGDPEGEVQGRRKGRNRRRKGNANVEAGKEAISNAAAKGLLTDGSEKETENTENVDSFDPAEKSVTVEDTEKNSSRSRSRGRRGRGKSRNRQESSSDAVSTDMTSVNDEAEKDSSEPESKEDGFLIIQSSEVQRTEEEPKNRKDKKKDSPKKKQRNKKTESSENGQKTKSNDRKADISKAAEAEAVKDISKSSNYRYVYNALSDFLSKKTIDMYAQSIDEGIRKSNNKNELHQFFKKVYGPDEAEALYKIIYSDFDKMKKEAGN